MGKYRIPNDLPKEDYLTAVHYALRYPLWKAEIETSADTARAIRYDTDKVQTSNDFDPVQSTAIRREEIGRKIKLVDDVIAQTASGLDAFLRFGVCYGLTFWQLQGKGIPCSKNTYYTIRKRFYYELSQRI